jgi:hypothetical protein
MSFKAYIDNIESKTGKTPKDFKIAAEKKGLLEAGIKASVVFKWLKDDYGLGLVHILGLRLKIHLNFPLESGKLMQNTTRRGIQSNLKNVRNTCRI